MVFNVTSPVHFHFVRGGGAIVAARLSIWSGVGGPSPKRVDVINFDHPTHQEEDASPVLPSGLYTCVLKVFVRKELNGLYTASLFVDDQDVFGGVQSGDVSALPEQAELLEAQFDIQVS